MSYWKFLVIRFRQIIPLISLVSFAPTFFLFWFLLRLSHLIYLPAHLYRRYDDFLYSIYQRSVLFFFEHWIDIKIYLYGDYEKIFQRKENVLYISNHQSSVDWVIANMLAVRQGSLGHIRYILKSDLKWIPLYGFYFQEHGCIYVHRNDRKDLERVERGIRQIKSNGLPIWLVIFPEGTRFNPIQNPLAIERAKSFAQSKGLEPFENVLFPRSGATVAAINALKDQFDAIYDVTVIYGEKRFVAPSMAEYFHGETKEIHIRIDRISIDSFSKENNEQISAWIYQRFQIKDKLLKDFSQSKWNEKGFLSQLDQRQTISAFLFLLFITISLLITVEGRSRMKLFSARDSWIVTNNEQSLWFNRRSLSIYSKSEPVNDEILNSAWEANFVQDICGYIGQIQLIQDGNHWLIFVKSEELVGQIEIEHQIYRITDILIQPFNLIEQDAEARANPSNNKYESKCIEEFRLWYQETQCFYYSPTYDLTKSTQRAMNDDRQIPLWKRADEKFFWNRPMIEKLIHQAEKNYFDDRWIQPIIMGYYNQCHFQLNEENSVQLIVISRRNRYRAGVRMHCRGIDEQGNVANYVETEQILFAGNNVMSFVMIRGSVPVFWSQAGIRYRPPPKLDRNFNESHQAFLNHFQEEFNRINQHQLILISLIDEWGKENLLNDAFFEHIVKFNNPNISYITFDFHEFCKGLQFGNVLTLLELLDEKQIFREMRFFWRNTEQQLVLSEQINLFRINCVDCLDRTNVVQAAIAKTILEIMLKKISLLDLDQGGLSHHTKNVFQTMWADNGDAISRQYAGTDAMKGDFTRTGRRDIKGVFADGKISANRYYRRFKKDTLRQQIYDAMQKQKSVIVDPSKDLSKTTTTIVSDLENNNEMSMAREEILKQMIFDCRKMFVCEEDEDCFGTWLLIDDSDSNEVVTEQIEPDCVFVLTSTRYFIVSYDDTFQKVVSFKETSLTSVDKVEVGPNPLLNGGNCWSLRIHYSKDGQENVYYHQFRGSNVQVFNTTVMFLKDVDQTNDYLKTIGQMLISIINNFAQKSLKLNEKTLTRLNSLPDQVETLQKRMSFSATDAPALMLIHNVPTTTNKVTFEKLKNFGSKFSSMVTRQAAPTLTKLTAQAKQLPINETVSSLFKVIGESPSLIRSTGDDGRSSPTIDNSRKGILKEKFDQRKSTLRSSQCQTKCFLFPSPDLSIVYFPNQDENESKS